MAPNRSHLVVSDLIDRIDRTLRSLNLLPEPAALVVAVSGGLDSMVLLDVLHRLAPQRAWALSVAHFNHRLRGTSSDADEALVRRTALSLGWPFCRDAADVRAFARRHRLSVEMAARRLRHEFLARVGRSLGIRTIALAHHADDQVELCFLRLLRGAGGEGLGGMAPVSASPADAQMQLVRPLLAITKRELAAYAKRAGIAYRPDASNVDVRFARNRIRRELLPLLRKKYQPALDKTVLRSMEIIDAESDFVDRAARAWRSAKQPSAFEQLHVAVQRQVLRIGLRECGVVADFDLVEKLRSAADCPVMVQPQLSVLRSPAGIVRTQGVAPPEFRPDQCVVEIKGRQGVNEFDGVTMAWRVQRGRGSSPPRSRTGRAIEYFDAAELGAGWVLRHWRRGDRFQPIGQRHAAKLQDLFVNQKIPRAQRHQLVVAATAQGEIFWVEGLRISERFKLRPGTTSRLRWSWRRLNPDPGRRDLDPVPKSVTAEPSLA